MTPQEMAAKIVQHVAGNPGTSFVELFDELGADARGDGWLTTTKNKNVILWTGISETFRQALNLAMAELEMDPCNVLVYLMDGATLPLPLVKRNHPYRKPHWLPVTLTKKADMKNAE